MIKATGHITGKTCEIHITGLSHIQYEVINGMLISWNTEMKECSGLSGE